MIFHRVHFHVVGKPTAQGSKRGIVHRNTGKVVMIESSKRLKPWRESVRWTALEARKSLEPLDCPVDVNLCFDFLRPKSHFGFKRIKDSAPRFHKQKPDIDKLSRAVLDALTGVLFQDDSQVVRLVAVKRWISKGYEGAWIDVKEVV